MRETLMTLAVVAALGAAGCGESEWVGRAELATDVGADPSAVLDEEARTAAGHLAVEDGEECGIE